VRLRAVFDHDEKRVRDLEVHTRSSANVRARAGGMPEVAGDVARDRARLVASVSGHEAAHREAMRQRSEVRSAIDSGLTPMDDLNAHDASLREATYEGNADPGLRSRLLRMPCNAPTRSPPLDSG
jgi:hypothetical protein